MACIHVDLVMCISGSMSIFLDSSFWILWSPFSVFAIRWIVMDPISSAILWQAVMISGL